MMLKHANSTPLLIVIALLFAGLGVYFGGNSDSALREPASADSTSPPAGLEGTIILPKAKKLSDFSFTTHLDETFDKDSFKGRWSIIFFGFTHCPDICPTTMYMLKQVKQKLLDSGAWGNYQVIMVSVDPERDTVERLSRYIPFYDEQFIGLTGPLDKTLTFAKELGIIFAANAKDDDGNYDVDHSAAIILVNPSSQMAGVIPAPHKLEAVSHDLGLLASHYSSDHTTRSTNTPNHEAKLVLDETPLESQATPSVYEIVVTDAWIRSPSPNSESFAAYLNFKNSTNTKVILEGVSSPQFDEVMLHETVISDGVASMQHLDQLEIPPYSTLTFRPMAKHLMLLDPVDGAEGLASIELTLHLQNGRDITFSAPLRETP